MPTMNKSLEQLTKRDRDSTIFAAVLACVVVVILYFIGKVFV